MQQGWGLNDDAFWEKIRIVSYYAANNFKKPIRLLEILKIPSVDGAAKTSNEGIVERAIALRNKLNQTFKSPT